MRTRYLMIATAAVAIAGSAAAEPAKPVHPAAQPTSRPTEVLMASAERMPAAVPAGAQADASAPVKRPRAARVTSCRCAGQNDQ